ncbi:hypothetical protein SNOG_03605 [Parastagonospora nodorum SN15]|uniref:Uncharacterized protein n=1 Tax=Phaeosphaeria nodorum (strain SN15 / ATCC MYA-4574 / FGSC 10173) TaxID=321614 RepID=Q0UXA9_PHANO|nr:hypothetical protein SNOG_03605 [Parastagonospora nodorum SN15]EAT88810.1 hypothetical protein SNOG_03605 [Parastagonospora nodorum SN15]
MSQQDVCSCVEKCIGFGFPISSMMRNSGFPVAGSMGNLKTWADTFKPTCTYV